MDLPEVVISQPVETVVTVAPGQTVVVRETQIEVVQVASAGGGGGGGSANVTFSAEFAQTALICSPVYISGAGTVSLAQANSSGTYRVVGLATSSVTAPNSASVQVAGVLSATTAQWDAVAGTSGGLTPGAVYWLSPSTPGGLTSTAPVTLGEYLVSIGEALSSTSLLLNFNGWAVLL